MADAPVDTPVDVIAPADEAPPQSMMPPREESGFPSLPWAAAGANELFRARPTAQPSPGRRTAPTAPCTHTRARADAQTR
eukprot:scaffold25090_cov57-Phaeocystis_antarctica.AAC.2